METPNGVRLRADNTNPVSPDVIKNSFQGYKEGYQKITQSRVSRALRRFIHSTGIPLFLLLATPNGIMLMWYTAATCGGSYGKMVTVFSGRSIIEGFGEIWSNVPIGSSFSIMLLIGYCMWAILMMRLLPGRNVEGPITPKGNVPVYKNNGLLHFVSSMGAVALLTCVLKYFGLSPTVVYDRFGEILATLSLFSYTFCLFLYIKGNLAPSSSDCGKSGNFIFDYYWGTELYPRVFGIDIKVFTNCRFGMTVWGLLVAIFALKSYELWGFVDSMFVSTLLQLAYITKFFCWEAGYMRTIDIMLDRAGFYICWGCLVFIPGMYASVSMYLVNQPVHLGPVLSCIILLCGLFSICMNYLADWQKQEVRFADGNCLVWGKKPNIIRAKYTLESGEEKESILLASGWWGLSRHFHYIPEILLAFFWTAPALFENLMPFTYVIYLIILLIHRSYRDDAKCEKKYGTFWTEYCRKVPHRIVPGFF